MTCKKLLYVLSPLFKAAHDTFTIKEIGEQKNRKGKPRTEAVSQYTGVGDKTGVLITGGEEVLWHKIKTTRSQGIRKAPPNFFPQKKLQIDRWLKKMDMAAGRRTEGRYGSTVSFYFHIKNTQKHIKSLC